MAKPQPHKKANTVEVVRLRKEGYSYGQISMRVGVSKQRVQQILKRLASETLGVDHAPAVERASKSRQAYAERVIAMEREGLKLSEIAEVMGCTQSNVCHLLRSHGIKRQDREKPPDRWFWIAEQRAAGRVFSAIAADLGISTATCIQSYHYHRRKQERGRNA